METLILELADGRLAVVSTDAIWLAEENESVANLLAGIAVSAGEANKDELLGARIVA